MHQRILVNYLERLAVVDRGSGVFALFALLFAGLCLLVVKRGELVFRLLHLQYIVTNESTNTNAIYGHTSA